MVAQLFSVFHAVDEISFRINFSFTRELFALSVEFSVFVGGFNMDLSALEVLDSFTVQLVLLVLGFFLQLPVIKVYMILAMLRPFNIIYLLLHCSIR